jgi:hypothetical protein
MYVIHTNKLYNLLIAIMLLTDNICKLISTHNDVKKVELQTHIISHSLQLTATPPWKLSPAADQRTEIKIKKFTS